MNIKMVAALLLLFPLVTYAQPPEQTKGSTLTVYSDNHEKFVLVLNGKQQNKVAKDDIKLEGLDQPVYDCKIVFEDASLPTLLADMRVTTPNGTRADAYYNIRRTLDGTIELHFLSVVPINDKYLSNDLKYFAHKGGYGGQFIDYTAAVATKKTTHTEMVNGQMVTVSSAKTGFDLSGKPISDKDVKFIDYSAPQAQETTVATTTTNAKGEKITTMTKKLKTDDVYGTPDQGYNSRTARQATVPTIATTDLTVVAYDDAQKEKPVVIDAAKVTNREVIKEDLHADYMNIQSSPVSTAQDNTSVVISDPTGNGMPAVAPQPTPNLPVTTVVTRRQGRYVTTTTTTDNPVIVTPPVTTVVTRQDRTTTTTITDNRVSGVDDVEDVTPRGNVVVAPVMTPTVTAPVITAPVQTQPMAATVDVTPQPVRTTDSKVFRNELRKAANSNANAGVDDGLESKHSENIKKMFNAVAPYDEKERPAPAPPVSNIDTTIDNGQLVIVTPATMPGTTPTPTGTLGTTTVVSSAPVVMDGSSTPYVNSANYTGYNSDGTRRISNAPCPNPMDVPSFDEAKADISALPDDGTKLSTAMMLENSYCFTSQQVFELCMLYTSEHTKLEFAKTSYSKTVDPVNYFKVNNAFQDDASVKDLKDFLDKMK